MELAEIRKQQGLTQEQVAKSVEIDRGSYANIEKGNRRPSVEAAKRIANVLGFDWTEFYPDEPEQ